ncbi:hypothetical protein M885DRAFT_108082 [Pelagophyceae sp. CCMP2097]|nr:hypothetical protein M885DRAFT_108082 [Pelagophyceae sp. CCMP2097]
MPRRAVLLWLCGGVAALLRPDARAPFRSVAHAVSSNAPAERSNAVTADDAKAREREAFMLSRGFRYDERGKWVAPPRRGPLIARSPGSNRLLEVHVGPAAEEAHVKRSVEDFRATLRSAADAGHSPRTVFERAAGRRLGATPKQGAAALVALQVALFFAVSGADGVDAVLWGGLGDVTRAAAEPARLWAAAALCGVTLAAGPEALRQPSSVSGVLEQAVADGSTRVCRLERRARGAGAAGVAALRR